MPQVQEALMPHAQTWDGSGTVLLLGVPARVEPVADDAPLSADSIEADGACLWLDDAIGGLCQDLVVLGVGPSMPGCTTPGDVVPAPEFSGAMSPGVARLHLAGSLGSLSPPIN
jgi:hypothetical protein